ncbi:PBP1A family penicillin-binding protein [Deltaproteobacteria bacterium TL4]
MKRLLWLLLFGTVGFIGSGLVGMVLAFFLWYPEMVLDFEYAIAHSPQNTVLYDLQGKPFHVLKGLENRRIIPHEQISNFLILSVLAAEDVRFFQHRGIDVFRLFKALWINISNASYSQGASTITQQLAKITLLTPERTLIRKFREIFIAWALELKYDKFQILEYYLNSIYLGHGNYGVEQASLSYYRKHASALNLAESAMLAGIIKKPEKLLRFPTHKKSDSSPYISASLIPKALKRQRLILRKLVSVRWITPEQYQKALQTEVRILPTRSKYKSGAYFVQHIINLLKNEHHLNYINGGGYQVYTTLDSNLQQYGEALFEQSFAELSLNAKQAALVSIEPQTGYVRSLVGGLNFEDSQFNRATQAQRQPGSAFKTFVYATALEQGFAPNSSFTDESLSFEWERENGEVGVYEPRNSDRLYGAERPLFNSYHGTYFEDQMTLAKAFEKSVNSIAVQLLHTVGIDNVIRNVKNLGLTIPSNTGLCLALGCAEVSLLDLTAAYTPFMNKGFFTKPVFILKILNNQGQVLYEHSPQEKVSVFSEWTVHQMNQMLHQVTMRGTGKNANWEHNHRFIAGKTGTTTDYRDAWFIGFSAELATGVWIGHDDNTPMSGESGGRTPALLWKSFMKEALSQVPNTNQWVGSPSVSFPTCTVSGDLATVNCPDVADYDYPLDKIPYRPCGLHPGQLLSGGAP